MTRNRPHHTPYEPVAIVGIGCRYPGGIVSPQSFWDFLMRGGDGTREVPEGRWSLDRHYDPERGKPGKIYTRRGGFIDDVKGFDPQFFGISPREAAYMDPQQRLLLETAWEAFEDAGIAPTSLTRRKVGVYIGLFTHDYENIHMRTSERPLHSTHSATGMSTTISANRLSYAFDFMGPSLVVDTACSSSLVATHLACRALQSGEAEVALAGGVNLQLSPDMTMALSNASMLSPDGRSKTFDARANGYARADGVGVVVLKPLARAEADGDAIYAVIAGSAVNQDGHSPGITVPNGEAQKIVFGDALAAAGLGGADISYVEAHGTGTPVGDPIEARALGTVLGAGRPADRPCVIGSVKSNFGHAESAAGVAGLIKVALMQHHGRIPANLHFETPNPNIPFADLNIRVPLASEDWPADAEGRRHAGVNSFGFGGTNAHVIVARAPDRPTVDGAGRAAHGLGLFAVSARGKEALAAAASRLSAYLGAPEAAAIDPDDIAAELALGRAHHGERLFVAAPDRAAAAALFAGFAAGDRQPGVVAGSVAAPGKLAFVCSGMGQQWWGMGRGLMASEPVFAEKIAEIDALFARLTDDHRLADLFCMDEANSPIDRTQYAQTAIFGIQVGLAALWDAVGVRPDFLVGHSVGEVAASHLSGALSLEDAVTVSFHRSRLQARLAGRGSMLAVGLSEAEIRPYLKGLADRVSFGAVNSPGSVTLAGDSKELKRLSARFEAEQVFARLLNVELPYHSPVMDEIGPDFRAALAGIAPRPTLIPLVSTVTGAPIEGTALDAGYWVHNIREPVNFRKAMATLAAAGCTGFVELGAHPVLSTSINECLAADGVAGVAIASQRRKQDDTVAFWSAFGQLYCRGHAVDFGRLFRRTGRRVGLPTYPFQHAPYWMESTESHRDRTGRDRDDAPGPHPLLGDRQVAPHPTWRSEIGPDRPAFLTDHRVEDSVVFPAAGYIELALAACRAEAGADRPLVLESLRIESALVLTAGHAARLEVSLGAGGRFEIHSQTGRSDEQHWMRHVAGTVGAAPDGTASPELDWSAIEARLPATETGEVFYRRFAATGLGYGPRFRNIDTAWIGDGEVLGHFAATATPEAERADYVLHPAVLDSTFQLLAGLPEDGTYLPVAIERISVFRPGEVIAWAHMRLAGKSRTRISADIAVANADGQVIATVEGLACQLFEDADPAARAAGDDFLYLESWIEAPLAADPDRPSEAIPDLAELAGVLAARHRARDREKSADRFVTGALPRIDALALDYFVEALGALGWHWQPGRRFTAAELVAELGIVPRHRDFVGRMLSLLGAAGGLAADGEGWRVARSLSAPPAVETWRRLVGEHPDCHAELVLVERCGSGLARFLVGADEPLFAIFPKDCPIAEHLYTDAPTFRPYNRIVADLVCELVARLGEGRPLRILEIGAGTGGLAACLLPLLPPERSDYVFTDLSERFLGQARQRFRNHAFVRYDKLDIETDPDAQGFAGETFDLVLGGDVLHATADLRRTLGHVAQLLKPGGALALIEATGAPAWFDLVFGLLPGWWAFADSDLRPDHATLPVGRWLDLFAASGFASAEAIVDDFSGRPGPQSVLLARKPAAPAAERLWRPVGEGVAAPHRHRPVLLIADAEGIADDLAALLGDLGAEARLLKSAAGLDAALAALDAPGNGGGEAPAPVIVDLASLDRPAAEATPSDAAADLCAATRANLVAVCAHARRGRPSLIVVTGGAVAVAGEAPDPVGAALRGFVRSAMNERGEIDTRLVDLTAFADEDELAALALEILSDGREPEIALRGNRRLVSRVHRWRGLRATGDDATPYRMQATARPAPEEFAFHAAHLAAPGPGEVQLRLEATGVNFKDLALHAGLVDADAGEIGMEASGIVLAAGPGVTNLVPGDAAFGFVRHGMDAVVNVPAAMLVRKPETLSFEDAAGIPVVFFSAWHALKGLARLDEGETVLVHTGASGLGLAAIAVARALGARVLATAGTPEKRAYLRALGLDYVGESRGPAFAREVMEATGGAGVDVVLNTLGAGLAAHNFALVVPGTGRLVDVANVHYDASIAYATLARGLSVSGFDLAMLARDNPGYVTRRLEELAALFASGRLRPVPYRAVAVGRLSEVLQSLRRGTHIGKFVVSHRDTWLDLVPDAAPPALDADASYLITGGLTGFGLATARWLAASGARHLVLAGRRGAATPEAEAALAALCAAGVRVEAVACDVTDPARLAALIARFGAGWPPLRGLVHGAMVLRDAPIDQLGRDDIVAVLAPKIDGAVLLDRLTAGLDLDFFIAYSSISSLVGNRDQANYAAANSAVEALMAARRRRGKPGLAVGWGAIAETGLVARDGAIRAVFLRQGVYPLALDKAWTTLALGLSERRAYLGALAADWRKLGKFARVVAATPRFRLLGGAAAANGAAENGAGAAADGDVHAGNGAGGIEQAVVRDIAGVLGMKPEAVDINKPLPELGFDSLLAVELSVALEHSTGHGFNRMSLLRPDLTAAELIAIIGADTNGGGPSAAAAGADLAVPAGEVNVADLSDAEVEALLRQLSAGE